MKQNLSQSHASPSLSSFFIFSAHQSLLLITGKISPVPDFDLFLLNCFAARSCSDAFECCAHNRRSLQVRILGPFQTSRPLRRAFFWVLVFLRAVLPFYSFSFPVSANPTTIPPNVHFDMAFKLVLLRLSLRAISNILKMQSCPVAPCLCPSRMVGTSVSLRERIYLGVPERGEGKRRRREKKTSEAFRKVDEINDFRINFKF